MSEVPLYVNHARSQVLNGTNLMMGMVRLQVRSERERARERERERARERECERERESKCVCEREREKESKRKREREDLRVVRASPAKRPKSRPAVSPFPRWQRRIRHSYLTECIN